MKGTQTKLVIIGEDREAGGLLVGLRLAHQMSDWGRGAFDITVQPGLDLYDSQPRGGLPPADAIEQALPPGEKTRHQVDGAIVLAPSEALATGSTRDRERVEALPNCEGFIVSKELAVTRTSGFAIV